MGTDQQGKSNGAQKANNSSIKEQFEEGAGNLSTLLHSYEQKLKRLRKDNSLLRDQIELTKNDQKDVLSYKSKLINEQEKKLEEMKAEEESLRREYDKKIEDLEKHIQDTKIETEAKNKQQEQTIADLKSKLQSLRDFSTEKSRIENELVHLKSTIDRQQVDFAEQLHERDIHNIENITKLRKHMLENLSQAADSFKLKLDNHVFDSVKEAVSKFTEQERLFERCEVTLVDKAKEIDERERNFKDTAMVSSCLGQCESEIMKKLNQKDQRVESLLNLIETMKLENRSTQSLLENKVEAMSIQLQDKDKQVENLRTEVKSLEKEIGAARSDSSTIESKLNSLVDELKGDLEELIEVNESTHEVKSSTFAKMLTKIKN